MNPLAITDYTITTALGAGLQANWSRVTAGQSGLRSIDFLDIDDIRTWAGAVAGVDDVVLPPGLESFDCRNNRLAWLALQQDGFRAAAAAAAERYGPERVAVFMGTSTAGIHQTELAYRELDPVTGALPDWYQYPGTHNSYSIAEFTRLALGVSGISSAISTACSSSAKVFASAWRALACGWCDAAVVGGVDSLCLTTLYGFNALQLVSPEPCRPCAPSRSGISIGEAAGFALLQRDPGSSRYALLGYGESSDAYHMSSPHPEGDGAYLAMQAALQQAGIDAAEVDYINLHGTGTPANDAAECCAVTRLFGGDVACSSTKGWTGHTLGAAGIVEAVLCLQSLEHGLAPQTLNTVELDPALGANVLLAPKHAALQVVLSNSFGFGGSNCSLLLGTRP